MIFQYKITSPHAIKNYPIVSTLDALHSVIKITSHAIRSLYPNIDEIDFMIQQNKPIDNHLMLIYQIERLSDDVRFMIEKFKNCIYSNLDRESTHYIKPLSSPEDTSDRESKIPI